VGGETYNKLISQHGEDDPLEVEGAGADMPQARTLTMQSVIQLCRSALYDEIQAIRRKGTKPLILSDGHLLGEEAEGGFLYSFTLDAEVILPDDAPGKLTVGDVTAEATVISINGFTILLLVTQSLGREVRAARLVTDASFLLEKLRGRLGALESNPPAMTLPAKLLRSSVAGASAAHGADQPQLDTTGNASLNAYQRQAVAHVASSEVSYIWGPPGTGKTTTLGHTVAALLRQGESVLVVAHSNAAVDAAALAVGRQTRALAAYTEGRILRVGVSRTLGIDPAILPREIVRRKRPELVKRIEEIERERDQLSAQLAKAAGGAPVALQERLAELRKALQEQRELLRSEERALVGQARCVLCTLSKAALADEIYLRTFDAVIVDEASMAYIPADLYVASLARRRVAIFGDFRQLPPITQGDTQRIEEWLEPDIFELAGVVRNVEARAADPRLVMLAEQYRMHPQIAQIIARRFYAGRLITGAGVEEACAPITARIPQAGSPVVLMDTAGLRPFANKEAGEQTRAARRYGGNSRFNLVSALVAVELARAAAGEGAKATSVGIITPYAAQARLINKLLHDLTEPRERITCATVHRFQGSERDVIIYDTVESQPFSKAGLLLSGAGRGLEGRLLNVALSRAKGKLIILADLAHLRAVLPEHNIYLRVLGEIEQWLRPVRLTPSADVASGLATAEPLPGVTRFMSAGTAAGDAQQKTLAADLRSAEIVAIAGASPATGHHSLLTQARVASAISPTAHVYVGASGAPTLTARDYRWDGPTLPCLAIGIDQRILWIEGRDYVLRIEQPQTIKLLYGLWDLLPEAARTLKTTEQQRELTAKGQSPLGRTCSKCGAQLWVSVEYGRAALKCLNQQCGHSTPFTPTLATQFADMMRLACPECKGQLIGATGPNGVYLRCLSHPKCKGRQSLKDLI
jgi:hypothetical protein